MDTPLGPIGDWSEELVVAVNQMLYLPLPGVIYWGPEFIVLYNDAGLPVLSKKHPHSLGQPAAETWKELWHIIRPQIEEVYKAGEVTHMRRVPLPILQNDIIVTMYWDYVYAPIRNAKGKILGVNVVAQDMSTMVAAEESLKHSELQREGLLREAQESNQRLQLLLDSTEQGTWTFNKATGILNTDARTQSMFQMAELQGPIDSWISMLHEDDLARIDREWNLFLTGKAPFDTEYRIDHKDEVIWVRARAKVISSAEEPIIVAGLCEDITLRKQQDKMLIQTEKLAAVGRLASSIAHEINNPLESVTNLLYLAKASTEPGPVQEYLELAERELRRVSVISNQTLRFNKQATKPTVVTCYDLFSEALSLYQGRLVNSHIEVQKRKRAEQPAECFEGEIRQVLSNFISNAIDSMHGSGGSLILRSREATNWSTGQKGLALTVADTGTGIAPEKQKRIFDAFNTTKGIGGTGLGLWISKEIAERHKGAIRFRSSQGECHHGTVFSLFLPFEAALRTWGDSRVIVATV